MSKKGGFGKFLGGIALGAGLGILFAPDKGENTRKVSIIGYPNFDNLSKQEQKSIFSTFLISINEYYKKTNTKSFK